MKKFIITLLSVSIVHILYSQESLYSFPEDWLGSYEGILTINDLQDGTVDSIKMTFDFIEIEEKKWTYKMTYYSDRYGIIEKDYLITQPDSLKKNCYYLDEQDGILINLSVIGNSVYSLFTVDEWLISSTLSKHQDHLFYELVSSSKNSTIKTENIMEGEYDDEGMGIFEVESFSPSSVQSVKLYRIKE